MEHLQLDWPNGETSNEPEIICAVLGAISTQTMEGRTEPKIKVAKRIVLIPIESHESNNIYRAFHRFLLR
jgi:hypothetical protein